VESRRQLSSSQSPTRAAGRWKASAPSSMGVRPASGTRSTQPEHRRGRGVSHDGQRRHPSRSRSGEPRRPARRPARPARLTHLDDVRRERAVGEPAASRLEKVCAPGPDRPPRARGRPPAGAGSVAAAVARRTRSRAARSFTRARWGAATPTVSGGGQRERGRRRARRPRTSSAPRQRPCANRTGSGTSTPRRARGRGAAARPREPGARPAARSRRTATDSSGPTVAAASARRASPDDPRGRSLRQRRRDAAAFLGGGRPGTTDRQPAESEPHRARRVEQVGAGQRISAASVSPRRAAALTHERGIDGRVGRRTTKQPAWVSAGRPPRRLQE